ncbi:MAG: non-canonical purine NTP diphosphatase [Prevotellaceae bacterium]|jgi:XTP/dITP diphosphohydrolase|nr:non-canonical purine NTP diphosphatase [Prevotellaceae bacterium]
MKQIIFATGNAHKLEEACAILKDFKILSLNHLGFTEDIPETADTLQGNALLKARFIHQKYGMDCFSDDTGLEIAALGGAPGVHSARFAGEHKSPIDNMRKVLQLLENQQNRRAQFRTVIALIFNEKEYIFEGKTQGTIITEPRGSDGFGYDPVFMPDGYDKSFAQLAANKKNAISHRAMALKKMAYFLLKNK